MALEKTVVLKVNAKDAEKNLDELNEQLEIQKKVLIELQKELIAVEQLQRSTSVTNLSAQKKLAEQATILKNEIKGETLGLKELNIEQRSATAVINDLSKSQANSSKVIQGLDKFTGGYATKLKSVYNGFIESVKGIKLFNAGLSGMKKALIATGVGALVVALGTIIAYWDDIKGFVNGVSSEQSNLLDLTNKTLVTQQEQLATTGAMENTLKVQGKSEKEIRDIKRQQTDEVIASTELLLTQQKSLKKSQVEAAERNQKITAGIIGFLTLPVTVLLGAVDALTYGLAKIGVIEKSTNLAKNFVMGTASLLFDPEDAKTEGDALLKETKNQLIKLKNTRDGYKVQDKKEKLESSEKEKEKAIKAEKLKVEALERIRKGLIDTEAEERAERLRLIEEDYKEQIKLAEKYYADSAEKVKELEAAKTAARNKQKEADELKDKAIADEKALKASEDAALKLELDKEESILSFDEQRQLIQDREDVLKEDKSINDKDRLKLLKQFGAAKIEIDKIEEAAQKERVLNTADALNNLSAVVGQNTVAGKGMSIAAATINTYQGVTDALAAKTITPFDTALKFVNAAAILGTGLRTVQKIASVKIPATSGGGGMGGARMPSGGINAPQAPSFNVVGSSDTNQLADAIGGQAKQPIKAYVVSNDITTAQSLDRNIVKGSSI